MLSSPPFKLERLKKAWLAYTSRQRHRVHRVHRAEMFERWSW